MAEERYGSYRPTRPLGKGGMGEVWEAEHVLLGKRAALKRLRSDLSADKEAVQRFFNEARATTQVEHPGIVEVFDFGFADDGRAYIVMELLDGETLTARIRRERMLPLDFACVIARQIAGAIAAAHRKGIVHRDLKPDNVFLVPHPEIPIGVQAKILDFGIAKLQRTEPADAVVATRTGALVGTPLYMSPEQCRGISSIDHRADIYALGCILFELVLGKVPFTGEGVGDVIAAHIHAPVPDPLATNSYLPRGLAALMRALLAKRPDDRPATMAQVAEALDRELAALGVDAPSGSARPASARPVPTDPRLDTLPPPGAPDAPDAPATDRATPLALDATLDGTAPGATPSPAAARRDPTPTLPAPAPAADTTLGGAAGERRTGSRAPSRRAVLAGGATLAVGAAATGLLALRGSGGGRPADLPLRLVTRAPARLAELHDELELRWGMDRDDRRAPVAVTAAPLSLVILVETTEPFLGNTSYERDDRLVIDGAYDPVRALLRSLARTLSPDDGVQVLGYGARVTRLGPGTGFVAPSALLEDILPGAIRYHRAVVADVVGGVTDAIEHALHRGGDRAILVVGSGNALAVDDHRRSREVHERASAAAIEIAAAWADGHESAGLDPRVGRDLAGPRQRVTRPALIRDAARELLGDLPRTWTLAFEVPGALRGARRLELRRAGDIVAELEVTVGSSEPVAIEPLTLP